MDVRPHVGLKDARVTRVVQGGEITKLRDRDHAPEKMVFISL